MSDSRPNHRRKVSLATVIVLVLTTAVSTAVLAGHQFSDVPESNQFHGSISWMADNEITVGCNEAGTEFCPGDNVRRETMASFMRRFAQTYGAVGDSVLDFDSEVTVDDSAAFEVGSVEVTPKAEANVVLNGHATLEKTTTAEGRYDVTIKRDDCAGQLLARGRWRGNMNSEASFESVTVAVTGVDVVSETTTYVLCVAHGEGTHPDVAVNFRGLTATWAPTS
jgi:hypothetical protein